MKPDVTKDYRVEIDAGWKNLNKLIPKYELEGLCGMGWFARRRYTRAKGHFVRAYELDPKGWEAVWGLGKIAWLERDVEGAFVYSKEAAVGHRKSSELFSDLVRLALALDKLTEAEMYARAAVELEPRNSELLSDYALVLMVNRHVKRAIGVATNACKLNPDDGRNWDVLQWVRRVDKGEEELPESIAL